MSESNVSGPSLSSQKGRSLGGGTKRRRKPRGPRTERVSTRRASSLRWLFVLFAGALAAAILLVLRSGDEFVYVVRFSTDVPALTLVAPSSLEAAPVPSEAIEPGTFSGTDPAALLAEVEEFTAGRWLSFPVSERQQLRRSMFTNAGELAVPLDAGERLVSISAPAPRAIAGRVRPGDRVDVYVSGPNGVTGLLGSGVEVVAISIQPAQFDTIASQQLARRGDSFEDLAPTDPVPGTYVLRVDSSDVANFIAADASGRIYLVLRGPDASVSSSRPRDLAEVLCGQTPRAPSCVGLVDAGLFEPAAPAPAAPRPAPDFGSDQ